MKNLLNQIRDIVRNSFDRFLCSLPVIGDALRLVRILYQLVREQKTSAEAMRARVEQIQRDRITDSLAIRENCHRQIDAVCARMNSIREELHERIDALLFESRRDDNIIINRMDCASIVRKLDALETVQRVPDLTVEEMDADHVIWSRTACQPTN